MRIAIHSGLSMRGTVDGIVDQVRRVAEYGLNGYWAPMLTGHDTLTALAIAGREVDGVELGTAVVPMPLRPPYALAQQVATVQEIVGGRLALGLGPSHEMLVRDAFGLEWPPPLATTRRYVAELREIMAGEGGRSIAVGGSAPPLLLGTVNPKMAELAAEVADGAVTWSVGPRTVADVVRPALRDRPADRPFRIVAALPVCVTDDPAGAREHIHRVLGANDRLPSYRKVLAREGVAGVAELSIVGSAQEVARGLDAFAEAGATDLAAHVLTKSDVDTETTWAFLADRERNRRSAGQKA